MSEKVYMKNLNLKNKQILIFLNKKSEKKYITICIAKSRFKKNCIK